MMEFAVGDIIQTKKKHPCGSDTWRIMRLGADVKLKCTGCGRIVMMDREHFEKRARRVVEKADE